MAGPSCLENGDSQLKFQFHVLLADSDEQLVLQFLLICSLFTENLFQDSTCSFTDSMVKS